MHLSPQTRLLGVMTSIACTLLLTTACVPDLGENIVQNDPNHDFDGDGFTEVQGDCDDSLDTGPEINPNAQEVCDGVDNDCNDDKGRESERDTEKQEPGSGSILASLCGIGPFAAGARTALSAWVWLSPPDTLSKGAGNDDQGPRALFHVPLRTLPEAEYTLDSRLGWSDSSSGGTKDNAGADLSPAVVVGHPSAPEHFLVLE